MDGKDIIDIWHCELDPCIANNSLQLNVTHGQSIIIIGNHWLAVCINHKYLIPGSTELILLCFIVIIAIKQL